MTVRPFVPFPDKRLRSSALPVDAVTPEVEAIWQDMLDTMYAMPGLGLAAPQIGVMLRLAVVDGAGDGKAPLKLANPELIDTSSDLREHNEASPNLPGVSAKIMRPRKVAVRYLDAQGMLVRKDLEGVWATSVQHQIDHLNGKMYFDHLSSTKRKMLIAKAQKMARRA